MLAMPLHAQLHSCLPSSISQHSVSRPQDAASRQACCCDAPRPALATLHLISPPPPHPPPQVDDTAANDAEDTLVEMAFHVPPSNAEYKGPEEGDMPSKMLSEQLLALTDAGGAAAEEAVCAFDDVAILAPRGRFSVEMHHGFLKLSGQTQDFKIRWASRGLQQWALAQLRLQVGVLVGLAVALDTQAKG